MKRLAVSAAIAAMLFGVNGAASIAQSSSDTIDYTVVSEHDTASDATATRETLALTSVAGNPTVTISNERGARSFVSETASDGEIKSPATDTSIACYNMAQSMLAAYAQAPAKPFVLNVAFVGKPLAIPLDLKAEKSSDGTAVITASGGAEGTFTNANDTIPGGLMIAAKLVERGGVIRDAAFSEVTLLGATPQPIDRTQCSLQRVENEAPALSGGVAT